MKQYEAVVIGGGPGGITSLLYLLRSGAQVAWVEKMAPGGQMLLTPWIDNYLGFPDGINAFELVDLMTKHLEPFSYDKYMDEVLQIKPEKGKNKIQLGEEWLEAKTIIICSGAEHRKLGLPGEEELTGQGVSYCGICDGQFFKDQVVACIGGGNTALEDSVYLAGLAKKVYLIHRRDEFRGEKVYQDNVFSEPKIEVLFDTVPLNIIGQDQVQGLEIQNVKSKEKSELKVDGIFIFVGIDPQIEFLPEEFNKDEEGFLMTDTEMRTNIPGIFAAGDIRSKRCRQVCTAVGDGATAGHSAHLFLKEIE